MLIQIYWRFVFLFLFKLKFEIRIIEMEMLVMNLAGYEVFKLKFFNFFPEAMNLAGSANADATSTGEATLRTVPHRLEKQDCRTRIARCACIFVSADAHPIARCACARAGPGSRGWPPPTAPHPSPRRHRALHWPRGPHPPPRRVKLHHPISLTSPRLHLSSRPHPSTHPPASPPSTATTPIFALSAHPHLSAPVSVRTRPPPTSPWPSRIRSRTRPCSGRRARTAAGGRALFSLPRLRPAAPWASRLSALRISSSTGGKVLVSCFPVSSLDRSGEFHEDLVRIGYTGSVGW